MKLLIPPPVQAIICAGLMWLIAKQFPQFGFSVALQEPVAILICIFGIAIDLISVGLFAQKKTTVSPFSPNKTANLVTSGLYQFTRNPMYLGMVFILTGLGVWLGNFAAFLMVPCFIGYITKLQIIPEEEILLEKFGEDFGEYMLRVRRWI